MKKYYTTNKNGEEVWVTQEVAKKLVEQGKKTPADFMIEEVEEVKPTPKFGPEQAEFDLPAEQMSPEARAFQVAQKTDTPYDEALMMGGAFPRTMSGIAEGESPTISGLTGDALSYFGRGITSLDPRETGDLRSKGMLRDVIGSPELMASIIGGAGGGRLLSGMGRYGQGLGTILGEGVGDFAGQATDRNVGWGDLGMSLGFSALGGGIGKALEKGIGGARAVGRWAGDRSNMMDELHAATKVPSEALDFASVPENLPKLRAAKIDSDIPMDLVTQLRSAKPSPQITQGIETALDNMEPLDLMPLMKDIDSKMIDGPFGYQKEVNNQLGEILGDYDSFLDAYNVRNGLDPTNTKVDPRSYKKLREIIDQSINFDDKLEGTRTALNSMLKDHRGIMKESLIDAAPTEEYAQSMAALSDWMNARSNVSDLVSKRASNEFESASGLLKSIGTERNSQRLAKIRELDKQMGSDIAKRTLLKKHADSFGGEATSRGVPTWSPIGSTGKFRAVLSNLSASPKFATDVVIPVVDEAGPLLKGIEKIDPVLKAMQKTKPVVRQGISQSDQRWNDYVKEAENKRMIELRSLGGR